MHEAKTNFSRIADEVAAGDEVVIARAGKPIMKLVEFVEEPAKRRPGLLRGLIEPVSKDDWQKMDEEIRANFTEDQLW
jgi:antitoxin (DNA-binding transcriptional repressor) of toxin-antitoxin stability system